MAPSANSLQYLLDKVSFHLNKLNLTINALKLTYIVLKYRKNVDFENQVKFSHSDENIKNDSNIIRSISTLQAQFNAV